LNVVKGFHVEKLQIHSAGRRLFADMDNSLDKTDRYGRFFMDTTNRLLYNLYSAGKSQK
jgi:hypothetical protein